MKTSRESVLCQICNTSEHEIKLYKIKSGFLVKCTKCGLYYVNPRNKDLIDSYKYGGVDELFEEKMFNINGKIKEFSEYIDEVEKLLGRKGNILDIGCFDGLLLNEAKKRGWNCFGIEPNIAAANYANKKYDVNVQSCVLENAKFNNKFFDAVIMSAVLEHHPYPIELLYGVKKLLKKNGIVVISVPYVPFYINILRSRWRMYICDHYYFLKNRPMKKMLEKVGLTIIKSSFVKKSVDLEVISERIVDKNQPTNMGYFGIVIKKIINGLHIEKFRININLFDIRVYYVREINN
jgi:SAM-dependent methyltransferase